MIEIYKPLFGAVNVTSSFDTVYNIWTPFILIAISVAILGILFTVSTDISKYRRFKKLFKHLSKMFNYCAYGMLTVAVIGFPCYLAYIGINVVSENPGTMIEIGKWTGVIFGAFIGFTLVGYVTKNRIWKRIWKYHKIETQYKNNMKELPKPYS